MKLRTFLQRNKIPLTVFAKRLGVAYQTLQRYLSGKRHPAAAVMAKIYGQTGGKVGPNDFYELKK